MIRFDSSYIPKGFCKSPWSNEQFDVLVFLKCWKCLFSASCSFKLEISLHIKVFKNALKLVSKGILTWLWVMADVLPLGGGSLCSVLQFGDV